MLPAPLAPLPGFPHPDTVLDRFLTVIAERGLELYPEQEEAILELFDGKNVILATPTGSGNSLVAAALHYKALCAGERSVYTCPIKALVNEKFLALCRDFGPENVGMATGDAGVLAYMVGAGVYVGKLLVGGTMLSLFETSIAKMRIFRVPDFLGAALMLGLVGALLLFVSRGM